MTGRMAGQPPVLEVPEDAEVRKVVWEGSIPLRIELEPKEVTTLTPPPPLFVSGTPVDQSSLLRVCSRPDEPDVPDCSLGRCR